jgi:ribonuclease HI
MIYEFYTDGACTLNCNNGKYSKGPGGWAWALIKDNEVTNWKNGGGPRTTNNEQELTAIMEALSYACKNTTQCDVVRIFSDSAYCINIFTQWINGWKANGWTRGKKHESIENLEIIKTIYEMVFSLENSFIAVEWVKVKGHSNNEFNNFVDQKAVEAKESQMKV